MADHLSIEGTCINRREEEKEDREGWWRMKGDIKFEKEKGILVLTHLTKPKS